MKPTLKHSQQEKLYHTPEDLRWATSQEVAQYRAERLKCKIIADIGCGIGFQTIAFAETCQKVYAVEINPEKIALAQKNAQILNINNIEFIPGDALDPQIIKRLLDVEIIFCDPERVAEEAERTISSIKPNILELLDKYSKITANIAIEFPPQIKNLPLDGEKEYLSVDGNVNRLTLYLGTLKRSERSAVILPTKAVLRNNPLATLSESKKLAQYLYEVNPAVVKAELLAELCTETKTWLYSRGKNTFCTSEHHIKSPFFKNSYKVIAKCLFEEQKIIELLQKHDAAKVTLRYTIDPKEYWKVRNKYESKLKGTTKYSLFQFDKEAVIGKSTE